MDHRNRYNNRSDDLETQFIPVQGTGGRRSDQYDTQELSATEIRRQIRQGQGADESARRQQYTPPQQAVPPLQQAPVNRPTQPTNSGYGRGLDSVPVLPPVNDYNYNEPYQENAAYTENYTGQGGRPVNDSQYGGPVNNGYYRPEQPAQQRSPQQQYYGGGNSQGGGNYYGRGNSQGGGNYYGGGNRQNAAPPQQRRQAPARRKKRPGWQTAVRALLILIIAFFLIYSAIAIIGIMRTNIVATAERSRTESAYDSSSVDNILVIGTDSRNIEEDRGRSDSIIMLSVNSGSKKVYMTSFLRDVYVYINDTYGSGKLNSAYAYGGPELLMDTIESNYGIKIDDYVIVSFAACAAVIDSVGGVETTLSDDEAKALNDILISEVNELMGDKRNDDLLDGGGTYLLSGKQALSYSRIRYVGNADFERTGRQREVLNAAIKKASKNPVALSRIFINALPEITTNMRGLGMYAYSLEAPYIFLSYDIEQQQIPADGTFYPDMRNGEDVLVTDFTENNQILRDTVYA